MKIGVIIIFHNNEEQIDPAFFIQQINQANNLELCLVNNHSKDRTYKLLNDIKEQCSNVSVVNIKKFKSDVSAVKAGARFMFNQFNLEHLGYATINLLKTKREGLNGLIKAITENQQVIVEYNTQQLDTQTIKLTLYQKLFSVMDYLKKLQVDNQFVKLQY